MKKNISILGSTGSIGINVLKIFEKEKKLFKFNILAADKNFRLICNQIKYLQPEIFIINNFQVFIKVKNKFKKSKVKIYNNIFQVKNFKKSDITISAIPGIAGLETTLKLTKKGSKILIANKESIICGWDLIKKAAKKFNTEIIPVDSEHFSIMELLKNHKITEIKKVYLTASGGPFLNYKISKLNKIKPSQAIKHPKWQMGKKISVDSASLMNKILESLEAQQLFFLEQKKIEIIIHPESLVHAIIEFNNGLIKFLYHQTSMIIPLANAIFDKNFDINKYIEKKNKKEFYFKNLNFSKVDSKRFPVIKLKSRVDEFNSTPIVINAVNEILVDQFLKQKIPFNSFYSYILKVLSDRNYRKYAIKKPKSIGEILQIDQWARYTTIKKLKI